LPRRLSGEETEQSAQAREFAAELAALTGLDVHMQDERLTSREAESRLAVRERDWRARKARLDAAAAAIILQDYLDAQPRAARDRTD
jgi:putative Holliday junction resolvase